jgi:hypothetical protein
MADDFNGKSIRLVTIRKDWCVHKTNIAHEPAVVQARRSVDNASILACPNGVGFTLLYTSNIF